MSRVFDMLTRLQEGKEEGARDGAGASAPYGGNLLSGEGAISFTARYGLRENPFADSLNPEYYFKTASHQRIGMRVFDTVSEGISLGLVVGRAGTGKTLLSQLLLQELDRERFLPVLVLVTPGMGKAALLREVLRECGEDDLPVRTKSLLDSLHRLVMNLHGDGKRLVILIDEAHFLRSDALHMLRTISNLETPRQKLCTTFLFAEEGFLRRLGHPSYRSLATRMYHRLQLEPLSEEETDHYITFRLMTAGGEADLITADARKAIHQRSGGICREVSRLGHLALLEGALANRDSIGPDVVEGL
jgi:general secretion pathway protein A